MFDKNVSVKYPLSEIEVSIRSVLQRLLAVYIRYTQPIFWLMLKVHAGTTDVYLQGTCHGIRTFCSPVGTFASRNESSRELSLSLLGTKVPRNFRSRELSFLV